MSGAWWRRNRVALIAIAVLVPAGWFALDTIEFGLTRNPEQSIGDGATLTIGGMTMGPVALAALDAGSVDAPASSAPTLVTIPVSADTDGTSCIGITVTEAATGRTWRSASSALEWEPAEGAQESCSAAAGDRFDLVAPVLLGDDVAGPLVVGVTVSDDGRVVDLRFDVAG